MSTQPFAIESFGLCLQLGKFIALEDVSFGIRAGTCTGIIGPNGAGKTTLLDCLSAFRRPTSGHAKVGGHDVAKIRPDQLVTQGVGRTFQNVEQFNRLRVNELALLGRHQRFRKSLIGTSLALPRANRREQEERQVVTELLERLQIQRHATFKLSDLPYSIRKVADLARALALEPRILLLDEPSAGMGAAEREQLREILHSVVEQSIETLVIVDHDIEFIRDLCDRLVVLDAGRLIAAGPSDEVLKQQPVIEAYLGA